MCRYVTYFFTKIEVIIFYHQTKFKKAVYRVHPSPPYAAPDLNVKNIIYLLIKINNVIRQ